MFVLGIVIAFSLVVLGLDIHLMANLKGRNIEDSFPAEGFGIGLGLITFLGMLTLFLSPTTFITSKLAAEASLTAQLGKDICGEGSDIEGVSYVNGFLLMLYTILLLSLGISGRRKWSDPVRSSDTVPTSHPGSSPWKEVF
ncbi:hypothetical protein ONZ45_g5946 [Pleurotus djamor]|nr:hypothetical protein ONZ45_g5946 [Pleurotus djamor]